MTTQAKGTKDGSAMNGTITCGRCGSRLPNGSANLVCTACYSFHAVAPTPAIGASLEDYKRRGAVAYERVKHADNCYCFDCVPYGTDKVTPNSSYQQLADFCEGCGESHTYTCEYQKQQAGEPIATTEPRDSNFLLQTIDAEKWADEWLEVIKTDPAIPTDKGTMLCWFANAIMMGFDEGQRRTQAETEPAVAVSLAVAAEREAIINELDALARDAVNIKTVMIYRQVIATIRARERATTEPSPRICNVDAQIDVNTPAQHDPSKPWPKCCGGGVVASQWTDTPPAESVTTSTPNFDKEHRAFNHLQGKVAPRPRFNVGDTVKLTQNPAKDDRVRRGEIGKVLHVFSDIIPTTYAIRFNVPDSVAFYDVEVRKHEGVKVLPTNHFPLCTFCGNYHTADVGCARAEGKFDPSLATYTATSRGVWVNRAYYTFTEKNTIARFDDEKQEPDESFAAPVTAYITEHGWKWEDVRVEGTPELNAVNFHHQHETLHYGLETKIWGLSVGGLFRGVFGNNDL